MDETIDLLIGVAPSLIEQVRITYHSAVMQYHAFMDEYRLALSQFGGQ